MANRKVMYLFLSAVFLFAGMSSVGAFAQSSAQPGFPSPADACRKLFEAAQKNDVQAASQILGVSTDLVTTNDDARDKADRETFVAKYQQMHRLRQEEDGTVILYVGAENWPLPFPLVEKDGLWHFDGAAGQKEILYRRIGRNELQAIALSHEFALARRHRRTSAYASPVSLLLASRSGLQPILIQGYYFRVLPGLRSQFLLIAYPAAYRSSGVMTFIVTEKNVVYEKDLGDESSSLAGAMQGFKKDSSWVRVRNR
jgi:hypothetical protein